jgi:hypothetical protein
LLRGRALPDQTKLLAQVSLARPFAGAPAWLPDRLQRLWVQHRDRRRYRLSYFLPVRAMLGAPEYWPAGRWVEARFALYVPTGAMPGTYALRARVVKQEFLPNTDLHSYVVDDDDTPGGTLDSVRVSAGRAVTAAAGGPDDRG